MVRGHKNKDGQNYNKYVLGSFLVQFCAHRYSPNESLESLKYLYISSESLRVHKNYEGHLGKKGFLLVSFVRVHLSTIWLPRCLSKSIRMFIGSKNLKNVCLSLEIKNGVSCSDCFCFESLLTPLTSQCERSFEFIKKSCSGHFCLEFRMSWFNPSESLRRSLTYYLSLLFLELSSIFLLFYMYINALIHVSKSEWCPGNFWPAWYWKCCLWVWVCWSTNAL